MPDLPTTPREVYARLPLDAACAIDRRPLERLIEAARAAYLAGESWRTIGCALGISRQGAQRRFGRVAGGE